MTGYDPLQLRDEVLEEYGVEVSLDECIECLKVDPNMTPESMAMMIQDRQAEENEPLKEGKVVKIPKGFKIVDFDSLNVPNSPGNYIWLLKDGCNLPQPKSMPNPIFNRIKVGDKELRVFYTGIGDNLSQRFRTHLNGRIARSTLRKSIAALMELPFESYMSGTKKKRRLSNEDEKKVSNWLRSNCILMYKGNKDCESMEQNLINELDPPLNIKGNPHHNNSSYVDQLSQLRSISEEGESDTNKISNNKTKWIYGFIIIIVLVSTLVLAILN